MSDFLDRFGDQLQAAQRLNAATAAEPPVRSVNPGRSRRLRLGVGALVGALLVAAPATAIIAPWEPSLHRAGVDDPVGIDRGAVATPAVEAFGVLRRAQTDDDRRLAAPMLQAIGAGNQVDRVQTHGIRAVGAGWALVPAKAMKTTPSARADEDVLCLTNGELIGCSADNRAATAGLFLTTASEKQTTLAGIAPDGVTGVRFSRAGGAVVEADVTSNFFALSAPQTGPKRMINAPPGYDGPERIPAPPEPAVGTLEWLDADGRVVRQTGIGR